MNSRINITFLTKLAKSLFEDAEHQEQFSVALLAGNLSEKAVIWLKERPAQIPFSVLPPADWQPEFVDRVGPKERPGSLPLHEDGAYYCLDLSSVFSASVLSHLVSKLENQTVLDACSAPGGKAIFAWKLLHPKILVCNEVIGKRAGALISNIKRCHISPCVVTRQDTREFAETSAATMPLVIVDAPCSGQSLIAKGDESPGCFHPATINMNSNRQKRILANSAVAVAPGGYLAYMTCTYSRQENEAVIEWLLKKFPQFSPCAAPVLSAHTSHLADFPCYRLWPQQGLGAGAFVTLLQNTEDAEAQELDLTKLKVVWQAPN